MLRTFSQIAADVLPGSATSTLPGSGKQTSMIQSSITELERISRMIMIISVNASIEASRVGEAGRGFSAVATEIRGLSQAANKVISSLRADYEGGR